MDDQRYMEYTLDFDNERLNQTASYTYVSSSPASSAPASSAPVNSNPFNEDDMFTGITPGN